MRSLSLRSMTHQETPMERVCQGRRGGARVKMIMETDEGEGSWEGGFVREAEELERRGRSCGRGFGKGEERRDWGGGGGGGGGGRGGGVEGEGRRGEIEKQ